ncbi:DUF4180 domain-containing protein [Actinophytocola sp.]|uniref:DUF4180 domain-containing protein n=1 Tax=Actinophytocola sp. TaxID=1872138 RepID=UPI002ED23DCF
MNAIAELHGKRVLTYEQDQPTLASEQDAVDLLGDAFGAEASVVVVPAERVAPDFYRLSTRVAGEVVRKFQMYQVLLVILGDVSEHVEASENFRAFVDEINRGKDIWFVADAAQLSAKLSS